MIPCSGSIRASICSRARPRRCGDAGAAAAGNFTGTCTAWPTATVTRPRDHRLIGRLVHVGHATALPMDSIVGWRASIPPAGPPPLPARHRPCRTNGGGVPGVAFAVRDAHQFILPSGDTVLAAEVVRRLNQEASPGGAPPDRARAGYRAGPGGAPPAYVVAYSERMSGLEDDVESSNARRGQLRHPPRQFPAIIVSRDYGDGSSYTLLERIAPRRWRARWNSAYVVCRPSRARRRRPAAETSASRRDRVVRTPRSR